MEQVLCALWAGGYGGASHSASMEGSGRDNQAPHFLSHPEALTTAFVLGVSEKAHCILL